MSGHVSQLSACGLRIDVVTKLTELINQAQSEKVFSEDDVFGTFYFLATNGSYKATGFAMTGKAKGWSEGNASRKIHAVVEAISKYCAEWVQWPHAILFHENNRGAPYFSDRVRVVVDTVPIRVPNMRQSNQFFSGKYKDHVIKVLGVGSFTGFYLWYPNYIYTGPSGDQVILQHSHMLEHMKHLGIKALADGGFQLPDDCGITGHSEDATVLIPHDILELYADEAKTEEKFLFNAQLSHIRARAEHLFDRNRLGRFNAFKVIWYMKLDFLFECVKVAMIALNLELYMQHGCGGHAVDAPPIPHESLLFQRERYPKPGPKAKKRKANEEGERARGQPSLGKWLKKGNNLLPEEGEGEELEEEEEGVLTEVVIVPDSRPLHPMFGNTARARRPSAMVLAPSETVARDDLVFLSSAMGTD